MALIQTPVSSGKKSNKLTKRRRAELEKQWHEHNRWLRRRHMSKISFDEFVRQSRGQVAKSQPQGTYQRPMTAHESRMAANRAIPSLTESRGNGVCGRKESPKYSGDYIKGIAQTHKSNAVPVVSREEIVDIRHMRR